MSKIAAVYCVYEDSGFLHESVRRIYPLMDKIVFLLNFKPWNGVGNVEYIQKTYSTILAMFDPEKKIEVVSAYWESEAEQRNFGLDLLHSKGIDWCFIIDDDEMYDDVLLKKAITKTILPSTKQVFLSPHLIYWKTKNFCINQIALALPSFCRTDRAQLHFNEARAIMVNNGGEWYTFKPEEIVCHHYSYVRDDDQMLRKIQNFSHADPSLKNWYDNTWLKWDITKENLHPNQDCPESFKKAINSTESQYQLPSLIVDKPFEKFLQNIKVKSHQHLNWLKADKSSRWVEFLFGFSEHELKMNKEFKLFSDHSSIAYWTVCEAILRSPHKEHCTAIHADTTVDAHMTYGNFCTRNEAVEGMKFDLVIRNDGVIPLTRYLLTDNENFKKSPFKHYFKYGSMYFVEI